MRQLQTQARGGTVLTPIRWFWLTAILTVAVDLASKALIFEMLGGGSPPDYNYQDEHIIWVLPSAFRLICHYNTGAAFGIFQGNLFLLLAASSILVPIVVLIAYHTPEPDAPLWGLGLVLGGALGNLWDRLFHVGVRDFMEIINPLTQKSAWPVFNVADVAIIAGVFIYLIWAVVDSLRRKKKTVAPEEV